MNNVSEARALPLLPLYRRSDVYSLIVRFLQEEGLPDAARHVLRCAHSLGVPTLDLTSLTQPQLSAHLSGMLTQLMHAPSGDLVGLRTMLEVDGVLHDLLGTGVPGQLAAGPANQPPLQSMQMHGHQVVGSMMESGVVPLPMDGGPGGIPSHMTADGAAYPMGMPMHDTGPSGGPSHGLASASATPYQPMSPLPELPAPSPELAPAQDLNRLSDPPQHPQLSEGGGGGGLSHGSHGGDGQQGIARTGSQGMPGTSGYAGSVAAAVAPSGAEVSFGPSMPHANSAVTGTSLQHSDGGGGASGLRGGGSGPVVGMPGGAVGALPTGYLPRPAPTSPNTSLNVQHSASMPSMQGMLLHGSMQPDAGLHMQHRPSNSSMGAAAGSQGGGVMQGVSRELDLGNVLLMQQQQQQQQQQQGLHGPSMHPADEGGTILDIINDDDDEEDDELDELESSMAGAASLNRVEHMHHMGRSTVRDEAIGVGTDGGDSLRDMFRASGPLAGLLEGDAVEGPGLGMRHGRGGGGDVDEGEGACGLHLRPLTVLRIGVDDGGLGVAAVGVEEEDGDQHHRRDCRHAVLGSPADLMTAGVLTPGLDYGDSPLDDENDDGDEALELAGPDSSEGGDEVRRQLSVADSQVGTSKGGGSARRNICGDGSGADSGSRDESGGQRARNWQKRMRSPSAPHSRSHSVSPVKSYSRSQTRSRSPRFRSADEVIGGASAVCPNAVTAGKIIQAPLSLAGRAPYSNASGFSAQRTAGPRREGDGNDRQQGDDRSGDAWQRGPWDRRDDRAPRGGGGGGGNGSRDRPWGGQERVGDGEGDGRRTQWEQDRRDRGREREGVRELGHKRDEGHKRDGPQRPGALHHDPGRRTGPSANGSGVHGVRRVGSSSEVRRSDYQEGRRVDNAPLSRGSPARQARSHEGDGAYKRSRVDVSRASDGRGGEDNRIGSARGNRQQDRNQEKQGLHEMGWKERERDGGGAEHMVNGSVRQGGRDRMPQESPGLGVGVGGGVAAGVQRGEQGSWEQVDRGKDRKADRRADRTHTHGTPLSRSAASSPRAMDASDHGGVRPTPSAGVVGAHVPTAPTGQSSVPRSGDASGAWGADNSAPNRPPIFMNGHAPSAERKTSLPQRQEASESRAGHWGPGQGRRNEEENGGRGHQEKGRSGGTSGGQGKGRPEGQGGELGWGRDMGGHGGRGIGKGEKHAERDRDRGEGRTRASGREGDREWNECGKEWSKRDTDRRERDRGEKERNNRDRAERDRDRGPPGSHVVRRDWAGRDKRSRS